MDAQFGSPEGDELELLSVLIEKYEEEHYPVDLPSPVEAIKFFMDQKGLTNAGMVQYFGHISKVSEVLNGKRPLSKSMIKNLVEGLGIPAEILLEVSAPLVGSFEYPVSDQELIYAGTVNADLQAGIYDKAVCWQSYAGQAADENYSLAA